MLASQSAADDKTGKYVCLHLRAIRRVKIPIQKLCLTDEFSGFSGPLYPMNSAACGQMRDCVSVVSFGLAAVIAEKPTPETIDCLLYSPRHSDFENTLVKLCPVARDHCVPLVICALKLLSYEINELTRLFRFFRNVIQLFTSMGQVIFQA